MPGGNKPGQVHHHKWEDNAYMIKIYRQSRILVVYQFECQEVAGKLFWVPIKACQWNHLTLLAEAQAQPPYYSTDYPWSSFLGTKSSEDPLLCSSQPTRFVEWFRQRWGNLHATTWRRSHYNQIVIDSTKVVATCIQQEFFDHTYPIFQVRLKDTAFTEGDEANFIPVYSPHQMLVIYNFRVSTARPSTDRRKQQSGITSEQGMGIPHSTHQPRRLVIPCHLLGHIHFSDTTTTYQDETSSGVVAVTRTMVLCVRSIYRSIGLC